MDLHVDLCGIRLANPFMLASGALGESVQELGRFQESSCGAVVTRTLRLQVREERRLFPSPHLALDRKRRWLLNCEWGNLYPLEYWGDTLPEATARGPVVVSVSGRDKADCEATVRTLARRGAALYEINFSCSHAGAMDGRINDDIDHVQTVVEAVKRVADAPVVAKLGWSPVLVPAARAAVRAGADAIAVTNSIGPGLDIDLATRRPRLGMGGGYGGVSGPAIFPIALRCVQEVVEAVPVPVVGVGGVTTIEDALKMMIVGATAVQIYTAALLHGPAVFDRMTAGLAGYLAEHGIKSVAQIRGTARPALSEPTRTTKLVPRVDEERCYPCGRCVAVCAPDAITLRDSALIDHDACTGCGLCVDVCPPNFDALTLH